MTCYYLTFQTLRNSVYTAYFSLTSFKPQTEADVAYVAKHKCEDSRVLVD